MRISENLSNKEERPRLLPDTHEHLKHSEALSFWATIPYFRSQVSETFCSVAAATMVVNAAKAAWTRTDVVVPLSQQDVLALAQDDEWEKAVTHRGRAVSMVRLKEVLITIFRKLGLDSIEVKAFRAIDEPECRDNFECALRLLDPSCDQFIIANFALGMVVGRGRIGHFAPIVSYSKKTDEVLLFDPDTEFHQPYWAPRESLFQAMLEKDANGEGRGYLLVRRE